jgi:phage terminase large subunit GpA-like protein
MGYADAGEIASGVLRAVFAPREDLAPDVWIERYWRVSAADQVGLMDLSRTPYLRKVVNAVREPGVTEVVFTGPAQCGKTEAVYGCLGWLQEYRPGHCMVMLSKADKAETDNAERFLPSVLRSPRVAGMLVGGAADQRRSMVRFVGGNIYWIGSNSEAGAEGTPAPNCWIDEYDRCDEIARKKLEQRGKTFPRRKVIKTGTPGLAGEGIDAEYESCDVRWSWHVPCPHCLWYFVRVWSRATVVWEGGMDAPLDDVKRHAWYACPRCQGKCLPSHRRWQGRLGVWLAQTQTVGPVTRGDGGDVAGLVSGRVPAGERWGFRVSGLDNDLLVNPVGEIASRFLREVRAHGRPGSVWESEDLGRARRIRARTLAVEHLRALASGSSHVRGRAPAGTVALVAGIDVQMDRAYVLVAALSPRMQRLAVVEWWEIGNLEDGAALERAILWVKSRRFEVDGGPPMGILAGMVDTGARATVLYQIKHRVGGWMRLVKGEASRDGKSKDLFRLTKTAVEQVSPLPLLIVNVGEWKNLLAASLSRPVGKANPETETETDLVGAAREMSVGGEAAVDGGVGGGGGGGGGVGFGVDLPRDVDDVLLTHLTSEHLSGGLWQLKREDTRNDWWDGLVYVTAGSVYYRARQITGRQDVEHGHGQVETVGHGSGRERGARRGGGSVAGGAGAVLADYL